MMTNKIFLQKQRKIFSTLNNKINRSIRKALKIYEVDNNKITKHKLNIYDNKIRISIFFVDNRGFNRDLAKVMLDIKIKDW
jgi:hypothetical protein